MRAALDPPSSERTTPTATSFILSGGCPASVARSTVESSSSGYESRSWPLYARHTGVRRAERITTSLADLERTALRPRGRRGEAMLAVQTSQDQFDQIT